MRRRALPALVLAMIAGDQGRAAPGETVVHRLNPDTTPIAGLRGRPPTAAMASADSLARAGSAKSPDGLFLAAVEAAMQVFAPSTRLVAWCSGPLLDQPDRVHARRLRVSDRQFVLELLHTNARAAGRNLERNLRWQPLVQLLLPEQLAPGEYTMSFIWRGVDPLSRQTPLPQPALTVAVQFAIR